MNKIIVLAIDRAEKQLVNACNKLAKLKNASIEAVLLVNEEFTRTPAYKGDETNGLFVEMRCDFNDKQALKKILTKFDNETVVLHCRMEEAIKDYQKVIELLPQATAQSVESLTLSTQKYEMRKAIASKYPNICPRFVHIKNKNEIENAPIENFSFPVIIKPNGLHSSFFVTKCENIKEAKLKSAKIFDEIDKVYKREYGTGDPSLVIEEFMEGEMYSVDAYVTKNNSYFFLPIVRVVTAAELGLDGYYSYRHIIPTELSFDEIERANECAQQGIEALGLTSSTAHVELYRTKNGWKIIEIGPRIGGYRQELYFEAFGIEHYFNDLLIHLGENPDIEHKWEKFAAGLNIYAENEGTIQAISGFDEALKVGSVVNLDCAVKPGDAAIFASNGGQFLVDGILANQDKDQLEADVSKVRNLIQFKVSKN